MIYMSKKSIEYDVNKYLENYVGQSGVELDRAVTAVIELKNDGIISEDLMKRLLKLLLSKHMHNEIVGELQADNWL